MAISNRHARGGRDEVLHGQRQHLGEIAHGRLAAVALPVGVGGKADGRVPGRVGGDRAEALRVERQESLQPLQGINNQQPQAVEEQHGNGIDFPVHLLVRADAAQAIDQFLDRPQDRVEKGAFALVNPGHERAERLGKGDQDDHVKDELKPTKDVHSNHSGFNRAITR